MSRQGAVLSGVLMLVVLVTLAVGGPPVSAAGTARAAPLTAPASAPDNSIRLDPFISGLSSPVFITHAGDGSNRLFIVEKGGPIKVVIGGVVQGTPFLDLSSLVSTESEQGLLGLAFHPQYEINGRFFVFYTAKMPAGQTLNKGDNTLQEYRVSPGNPNLADPNPVRTLFAIPDEFTNHNGGMIGFGPDGYLYVGMGDEGSGGDPKENAQNLSSLYGKLLRLDVDNGGNPLPPGFTYAIPPGNPFADGAGPNRDEIWALGFRNPWRWSFDRQTGDIYVGDVGQGAWEEIDRLPSGAGGLNFGWDDREGAHCFEPSSGCQTAGRTDPILEYSRTSNGTGCASVTGGYRYRGTASPALQGVYFYADFCSGRIWKGIAPSAPSGSWSAVEALDTPHSIASFGEDEAGELYVVNISGAIYRLVQTAPLEVTCDPRPNVGLQVRQEGPGHLWVTVSVTDNAGVPYNELRSLAFPRSVNADAIIPTPAPPVNGVFTFPPGTRSWGFSVRRRQAGQPMRVDIMATDRCGAWPTFVGGGTGLP